MRKRNAWLGLRLLPGALIVLGAGAPVAAGATIVRDDTIVGDVTHEFETVPLGVLPTVSLPGATYGERFAGQTLLGGALWDVLRGAPTPPLTLLPGAPNQAGGGIGERSDQRRRVVD